MADSSQFSVLIDRIRAGESAASDELFALLYAEFRSKAHRMLHFGPRQTLCTTELVNETWLRLHGRVQPVENRAHFCNLAARAMRQVLIDRSRNRSADKRGEGITPLTLCSADDVQAEQPFDVLALDSVMTELARIDAGLAELAQLHLFAGLSIVEIAELRGIPERTAFRHWRTARMYLVKTIGER